MGRQVRKVQETPKVQIEGVSDWNVDPSIGTRVSYYRDP